MFGVMPMAHDLAAGLGKLERILLGSATANSTITQTTKTFPITVSQDSQGRIYATVQATRGDSTSSITLNSATIGGHAATIHRQDNDRAISAIISIDEPITAGVVNVTATYSNNVDRAGASIYDLIGLENSAPFHSNGASSSGASSIGTTINVPDGGVILASTASRTSTGTPDFSAGVTRDWWGLHGTSHFMNGSEQEVAEETARTVTAQYGASERCCITVCSFR